MRYRGPLSQHHIVYVLMNGRGIYWRGEFRMIYIYFVDSVKKLNISEFVSLLTVQPLMIYNIFIMPVLDLEFNNKCYSAVDHKGTVFMKPSKYIYYIISKTLQ